MKNLKKTGIAASLVGLACVACCAFPIAGIFAAGSIAAGIEAFFCESAGWILPALSIGGAAGLLGYILMKRRKTQSCSLDCACNPNAH